MGILGPGGKELLRPQGVDGAETGVRGDELSGFKRREAGAPRRAAAASGAADGACWSGGCGTRAGEKGEKLKSRCVRLQRAGGNVCACGGVCGKPEWEAVVAVSTCCAAAGSEWTIVPDAAVKFGDGRRLVVVIEKGDGRHGT